MSPGSYYIFYANQPTAGIGMSVASRPIAQVVQRMIADDFEI